MLGGGSVGDLTARVTYLSSLSSVFCLTAACFVGRSNGDTPMVSWLLHKGAKSTIALFTGSRRTPLMAAASRNARDTVECLLGAKDAAEALAAVDAAGQAAAQLCGNPGIRAVLAAQQQRKG